MEIPLLVVSGGPASGKSVSLARVALEFGDAVQVTPELPTQMLRAFPTPGRDVEPTPELITLLQKGILPSQFALEEWHRKAAAEHGARLVVCDRGLLDGAAYVPGGLTAFAKIMGLDTDRVYSRYVRVVHLESLATCNPALYEQEKGSNPARYETLEQAVEREMATIEAWKGHPRWTFVAGSKGIAHVTTTVLDIVGSYLQEEHERKFRLPALPDINLGEGMPIEQGYLIAKPDFEQRVRTVDGVPFLGIKIEGEGQSRVSRGEWERQIPLRFFERAWPYTQGRRIFKTRYKVTYGDFLLEVDRYHGNHDGLVILECETPNAQDLQELVLPTWAAGAVEVTNDSRYSNRELALTQRIPD